MKHNTKYQNFIFTVINDVCDNNGIGRQMARYSGIFGKAPIFVSIKDDIEMSGEIIDQFAALRGAPGVIVAQSAPRTAKTNKSNGTRFCYFWVKDTLFVTSVDGYGLSLVKKLKLTKEIHVFSPETVFKELGLDDEKDSQFRSLELLPDVAKALLDKKKLTTTKMNINEIADIPLLVWHVDEWRGHTKWGNCKLTMIEDEKPDGAHLLVKGKKIPFYPRLKDVPEGKLGIVLGSSGIKSNRFYEIVAGNGNSAKILKLEVGSKL